LFVSATKILVSFTNIPIGELNCPSPVPFEPNFETKLPLKSNICTLLLYVSVTKILVLFAKMPFGLSNCPSNFETKLPLKSNI